MARCPNDARTRERRVRRYRPVVESSRRQILLALMTVALILAALGLVIVGLDAFNDLLARGVASLANPAG